VFSCHCLASICGDSFLASKASAEDDRYAAACQRWAQCYRDGMYPRREAASVVSFACTSGSLPHWLYREYGIPAFDLELGTNDDARPCIRDETTPELLDIYRDRHFNALVAVLTELAEQS